MGLLLATLQAFAIMMAISLVLMMVTMALMIFWIRYKVGNSIYAFIVENNNQVSRELVHVDGTQKATFKDGGEYIIVPGKTKWSKWPPGLPSWAQETIPTLLYSRNNPEPFDPSQAKAILSSQSLKYITDEGMLKATWQDAHEATGETGLLGKRWLKWLVIGDIIVTVATAAALWYVANLLLKSTNQVRELLDIVKGL